ncbi:MAG: cytochrome C [Flavobacteriaceae bacterium]|nr:MAG: cytochrome C [Flavobacteriaceae bacterium]
MVLSLILAIFYMLSGSWTAVFTSLYYWGTTLVAGLLLAIGNRVDKLIDNNVFRSLTQDQKVDFLLEKQKEKSYFKNFISSMYVKQSKEEEDAIIINHDFDGIQELDNALPKWWLSLFYFGVAFCVMYLFSYAFTDFAHPYVDYQKQNTELQQKFDAYVATLPDVTPENAVFKVDAIAQGEALFNANCASCHSAGGAGSVGPNLTDDHWINTPEKELFKNIFHMVWNGSPTNPQMVAFGKSKKIPGRDLEKIAAYVYHINQDIADAPKGKAAQGKKVVWEEAQGAK